MSNQVTIFDLSSNLEEIQYLENIRDLSISVEVRAFCFACFMYAGDETKIEEVQVALGTKATSSLEIQPFPVLRALQIIEMKEARAKHPAIRNSSEEICVYVATLDEERAACLTAFENVKSKDGLLDIAVCAHDSFMRYKALDKLFELYPEFGYSSLLQSIYENENNADCLYVLVKNAKLASFIDFVALSRNCELAQVNALVKCRNQQVFETVVYDKTYSHHPRMIAAKYLKDIEKRSKLLLEGAKMREDGKPLEDARVLWELVLGPQKEETLVKLLNDSSFWMHARVEAAKRIKDQNSMAACLTVETDPKLKEILAKRLENK